MWGNKHTQSTRNTWLTQNSHFDTPGKLNICISNLKAKISAGRLKVVSDMSVKPQMSIKGSYEGHEP